MTKDWSLVIQLGRGVPYHWIISGLALFPIITFIAFKIAAVFCHKLRRLWVSTYIKKFYPANPKPCTPKSPIKIPYTRPIWTLNPTPCKAHCPDHVFAQFPSTAETLTWTSKSRTCIGSWVGRGLWVFCFCFLVHVIQCSTLAACVVVVPLFFWTIPSIFPMFILFMH